jgi:hypothetical protein
VQRRSLRNSAHWKTGPRLSQSRPNVLKPQVSEFYIQNFEMQFVSVRSMAMIEKSFFRERFSPEVVAQFTERGIKLSVLHTLLTKLCDLMCGFEF